LHATDEPVDLSFYCCEDWITFLVFWLLAFTVFYQFFTRYVLSDSAGWTEKLLAALLGVALWRINGRPLEHPHPR
jgi:TRAP-type C4-dicarboxylate transport system permease small subunit